MFFKGPVSFEMKPNYFRDEEDENRVINQMMQGKYGLGQLDALPFSSLDRDEALPAPTPEKAMSRALSGKEGDVSDEYLVALAKANKAKSKTAKDYYMQEAQKVLNKDLFSSNMGMFG